MASAVPYEKFLRLQFLLGEDPGSVFETLRGAVVPELSIEQLVDLRLQVLGTAPEAVCAALEGRSKDLPEVVRRALAEPGQTWADAGLVHLFWENPREFQAALKYFGDPELRVRAETLVLSRRCAPAEISRALSGWSKYEFSTRAVELFSFYFCNWEVMGGFAEWRAYIRALRIEDHKWFLSRAYDVQSKGDLAVLLDDLSVRSAVLLTAEETAEDLMGLAFVHTKREERKVASGVPAKSTAVFEWADVYCSLFDRVQRAESSADQEDAVLSIQVKLEQAKTGERKKLADLQLAGKDSE